MEWECSNHCVLYLLPSAMTFSLPDIHWPFMHWSNDTQVAPLVQQQIALLCCKQLKTVLSQWRDHFYLGFPLVLQPELILKIRVSNGLQRIQYFPWAFPHLVMLTKCSSLIFTQWAFDLNSILFKTITSPKYLIPIRIMATKATRFITIPDIGKCALAKYSSGARNGPRNQQILSLYAFMVKRRRNGISSFKTMLRRFRKKGFYKFAGIQCRKRYLRNLWSDNATFGCREEIVGYGSNVNDFYAREFIPWKHNKLNLEVSVSTKAEPDRIFFARPVFNPIIEKKHLESSTINREWTLFFLSTF